MKIFYIYCYLDPRFPGKYQYDNYSFNHKPFYVGKGCKKRSEDHLKGKGKNKYLIERIKEIKDNNDIHPIISIYKSNLSEYESFYIEQKMINSIGRKDKNLGPLLNLTNGGEGCSGLIIKRTKEHNRKISESLTGKKHYYYGKHLSKEHRAKIGKALKNIKRSIETRKKMSKIPWNKDKKLNKEICEKMSKSKMGKLNHQYGKFRSIETKKSISESLKKNECHAKTWLISINEKIIEVRNLAKFCRDNNYDYMNIYRIAKRVET